MKGVQRTRSGTVTVHQHDQRVFARTFRPTFLQSQSMGDVSILTESPPDERLHAPHLVSQVVSVDTDPQSRFAGREPMRSKDSLRHHLGQRDREEEQTGPTVLSRVN